MKITTVAVFLLAASGLAAESPALPRIYVEPQEGFESFISAAIVKKQVPAVVTRNKEYASFIITSKVVEKEENIGSVVARCVFAYCIGIQGSQTATVQLVDATNQEVAWAYNVKKGGSNNYQSSAEAIAKHLKIWLASKHQ